MNDDQDTTQDDSTGAQALAEASPQEVDAHRGILSGVLEQLSSRGIDVASLAEKAGVSTDDVNALSHDDLAGLTGYLAQHHPQELAGVASQFPQAQGLLGSLLGGAGGGGGLGGMLSGLLGGGNKEGGGGLGGMLGGLMGGR